MIKLSLVRKIAIQYSFVCDENARLSDCYEVGARALEESRVCQDRRKWLGVWWCDDAEVAQSSLRIVVSSRRWYSACRR